MPIESLTIVFPDASSAQGNQLANSLRNALLDVDPSVAVDRQRNQPDTQDLGASLAVIFGTAAATALAKGIAAWLAKNSGACIEIRRRGEVVLTATHLDSKDVSRIVKAVSTAE